MIHRNSQSVRLVLLALAVTTAVVGSPVSSPAQEWAAGLFKTTSHDFGSVARGAKTEFAFELTNSFKEQVHIAAVRSSCGCTTPRLLDDTLDTYETSAIVAELNTTSFQGLKSATITVVIDRPFRAEVQLRVSGYIRTDVVIEPGECSFGDVEQGTPREQTLTIVYAGRPDWQILDVRSDSERLEAELTEVERDSRRISYKLLLRLRDDAEAGSFNEQIHLITNDRNLATIPLTVQGRVRGSIVASPSVLALGPVTAGTPLMKKAFLRGRGPFSISAVEVRDPAISFVIPEGENDVQFLPLTLTSDGSGRHVEETLTIRTSLGPVQLTIQGDLK